MTNQKTLSQKKQKRMQKSQCHSDMSKPGVTRIWGPLRSSMTKVTLLNGTDRCLSDWLNLFDWATGRLRLHKSFKGCRFCKCEKRGRKKKKGKRKSPYNTYSAVDTPTQTHENEHTHTRTHTHYSSFWRIYLFALNVLFIALPPQALSGHQPPTKACKAAKSVNCHCHWLETELRADDEATLEPNR